MKSKIKEKFQQAMDDGLFDRDAHEIEVTDTDKSVASNIKIFLDTLKEEFDILAAGILEVLSKVGHEFIVVCCRCARVVHAARIINI